MKLGYALKITDGEIKLRQAFLETIAVGRAKVEPGQYRTYRPFRHAEFYCRESEQ